MSTETSSESFGTLESLTLLIKLNSIFYVWWYLFSNRLKVLYHILRNIEGMAIYWSDNLVGLDCLFHELFVMYKLWRFWIGCHQFLCNILRDKVVVFEPFNFIFDTLGVLFCMYMKYIWITDKRLSNVFYLKLLNWCLETIFKIIRLCRSSNVTLLCYFFKMWIKNI